MLQGRDFSNLTFVAQQAPAAPVALAQLPPLAVGFTGRESELAQVAGLLDPEGSAGAVVVSAVAGLSGVGKTALAVHAAHSAREAGWFRGGVLFIDLHGYDQNPVQPGQALDALLRALGVPGEHIPEGAEQRAGLYRSVLAQVSEPVLIIADNASSEAQVRLLLPGPGPDRIIITSRNTLAGLGARLLDITVLDQAAAVQLLDQVVRAARPDDSRISDDRTAAERLAKGCCWLPLALQITAAQLAADPGLATAELADELADEACCLAALCYDDGSGAAAPSVAAAFESSYRRLDKDAKRLFRLLPAGPGPDVSTAASVALAGWPLRRARAAIGRLVRAHLVEPAAGERDRWRMHDLLRLYARQVPDSSPGEREQAIGRVLAWYVRYALAADEHLRALVGEPVPAEFTGRDAALARLDVERPNLVAAVTMAAVAGRHREAMLLPFVLSTYLSRRRRFDDSLVVLVVSRDRARQLNLKSVEATALSSLGHALMEVRRLEVAVSVCQDAVAIARETRDRRSEHDALNHLGPVLVEVRRFEEAVSVCRDAAVVSREIGDQHGEAIALNSLGLALVEVRRFEEAVSVYRDAAAISRETGDRHGEALALNGLGLALVEVRRFEEAVSVYRDAAVVFRETRDRYREGAALNNLGVVLVEVQQHCQAASSFRDAASGMREVGDYEKAALMEQMAVDAETGESPK